MVADLESVPCNLCGSTRTRALYRKPDTRFWISTEAFQVVRCLICGLGFLNPRPTRDAIKAFYPAAFYAGRDISRQGPRYEAQAAFLADLRPGRLLDVGCAGGAFLRVMQSRGWIVEGVDRFEIGGNEHGLDLHYGDLPTLNLPPARFDAVTAWGVLEHLHDPLGYLREIARVLRPGGRFVALVTNLHSVWSRYAFGEDIPRHLYFFSTGTLRRYAVETGLRLTAIDYSSSVLRADGRDVFRVRMLRALGFSWREVYRGGGGRGVLRFAERGATILGRIVTTRVLERALGIPGVVVGIMERPA